MDEDLTDAQRNELAAALEVLRDQLEHQLGLGSEQVKPVDLDQPIGRVSRIDAIQQQSMAKAARARHHTRLQMVLAAQARFGSGEYGECRICDDPIGYGRLKARPETPHCVGCQSELEAR